MNYSIFKLHFPGPVHFGESMSANSLETSQENFLADTLFSALALEALKSGGEEKIEAFINMAKEDRFRLSDSFLYKGDELYLPKPYILSDQKQDVPEDQRKKIKKLQWIPIDAFSVFMDSIHGGEFYRADGDHEVKPGELTIETKGTISRQGEDVSPYRVGRFDFADDFGLYFILAWEDEEALKTIESLVKSLGYTGIGGKTSIGYGQFKVSEIIDTKDLPKSQKWFDQALRDDARRYILLTTSLPKDSELEEVLDDAFYQLKKRSGFVQSEKYSKTPMKKKDQYFLKSGSSVTHRFDGDIYSVGNNGDHPVYRYSKPIFMGIDG